MSTILLLIAVALVVLLWIDGAHAHEAAIRQCRTRCERTEDVQLLDETVHLVRMRPRWTFDGLRLRRTYRFEYSELGYDRGHGHITLLGTRVEEFGLDRPEGVQVLPPEPDYIPPPRPPVSGVVVPFRRPPPRDLN